MDVFKYLLLYIQQIFLSGKCHLLIISVAYVQTFLMLSRLIYTMDANTIDSVQTAPNLREQYIVCNIGHKSA